MGSQTTEDALAALEQADAEPDQLLIKAAVIAGLNIEKISRDLVDGNTIEFREKSTTFKEQWLLKWLLRKLTVSTGNSAKSDPRTSSLFMTNVKSWSLLYSLLMIIPSEFVLEVFLERNFCEILNSSAATILAQKKPELISLSTITADDDVGADNDQRPRKRRKLIPRQDEEPDYTGTTSLLSLFLQVSQQYSSLIQRSMDGIDQRSKASVSGPPCSAYEVASLVGNLLQVTLWLIWTHAFSDGIQTACDHVNSIISLWDSLSLTTNVEDKLSLNQEFNQYCLHSLLLILKSLRAQFSSPTATATRKSIEQTIAIQTILPLRSTFNTSFAEMWKLDRDVFTWEDIQPAINALQRQLSGSFQCELHSDMSSNSQADPPTASILLQLGARTVPRIDPRRKQWERPWLEAFMLALTNIVCPALPQMYKIDGQTLGLAPSEGEFVPVDSVQGLVPLLAAATQANVEISLPVLSYLASSVIACQSGREPVWDILAMLLTMDNYLFVPSLGIGNSSALLDQLTRMILLADKVEGDTYIQIRDHIVVPIMRGLARARDMGGFIEIWQRNLDDAMRVRASGNSEHGYKSGISVWEDDILIQEFRNLYKVHATPSIGQALLNDVVRDLGRIGKRIGPSTDVFTKIAIFTAVIRSSDQDYSTLSISGSISELPAAICNALSRHSDFQGQRWRLWDLMRAMHQSTTHPKTLWDGMNESMYKKISIPLSDINDTTILQDQTNNRAKHDMERFMCFSFSVELASSGYKWALPVLWQQIGRLALLLNSNSREPSLTRLPKDGNVWNGHSSDIQDDLALASACIGMLLQKPDVLVSTDSSRQLLFQALCSVVAGPSVTLSSSQSAPCMNDLAFELIRLSSTRGADIFLPHHSEANGTDNEGDISNSTSLGRLLESLPVDSLSKSQLKIVAQSTFIQLMSDPSQHAAEAVARLALLERLASRSALFVCDPQNWQDLTVLTEKLATACGSHNMRLHNTGVSCLSKLFDRMWRNATRHDNLPKMKHVFRAMLKWCTQEIELEAQQEVELPTLLMVRLILRASKNSKEQLLDVISESNLTGLRKKFFGALCRRMEQNRWQTHDEHDELDEDSYARFESIWRAMDDFMDLAMTSGGLSDALQNAKVAADQALKAVSDDQPSLVEMLLSWKARIHHMQEDKLIPVPNGDAEQSLGNLRLGRNDCNTNADMKRLVAVADSFISNKHPSAFAEIMLALRSEEKYKSNVTSQLVISAIIATTQASDLLDEEALPDELGRIVSIEDTTHDRPLEALILSLENCKLVLDLHPSIVNQATVDTLLASVSTLASSSIGSQINRHPAVNGQADTARFVFERLCGIIGILLGRFRRRLADRHHLLLPALQSLLRCLFFAGTKTRLRPASQNINSQLLFIKSLPDWLRSSEDPLPSSSAQQFSRLLSSICNPTPSSARSTSRKTSSLNDETRKTRRIAGQHMQYLVMEYARCSLDGQIQPQVKDRLMPGMYAVLDAIDRPVMRGMNSAMDASSQAIFRGLYDDWTRYGKWDQS